jgi:F420-0:gamma-glutamyl ligase
MPIILRRIDHERRQIEVVASGAIYYVDVEKHLLEERNVGGLAYKEFIDASTAKPSFALTPAEIRKVISLVRNLALQSRHGATAVLVADDYALGVMNAYGIIVEDVGTVQAFRDEALARSWLDSTPVTAK